MKRVLIYLAWMASMLAACSISAEFFAYQFHYPAALGQRYMGYIYTPWDLLTWATGLNVPGNQMQYSLWLLAGQGALITLLWAFVYARFIKKSGDSFGTARRLKTSELAKLGAFHPGLVVLGQTDEAKYKRTVKTPARNDPAGSLAKEIWKMLTPGRIIYNSEPTHYLVVASTRSGKGISVVIPTLRRNRGSVVVYDIKKENWDVTAAYRSTFSDVIRFEPAASDTPRWNPLYEIRPGAREIPDAQLIGQMLQSLATKEADDDYWALSSAQLITGFILFVLYHPQIKEKSLYMVYLMMNHPKRSRTEVLDEMLAFPTDGLNATEQATVEAFKIIARSAKGMSPNERSGVFGTANAKLQVFVDPNVRRATSTSDFSIRSLVYEKRPKSLYIVVAPGDAERLKQLTRLLLLFIGQRLTLDTVEETKTRHPLLYLIDEFPSLGNLSFIEKQLAYFAGYKIQMMLIVQSFNQLYDIYGERTSIPDNCRVKVILGVDSNKEAKEISDYLGVSTVIREGEGKSQSANQSFEGTTSQNLSEGARQLLTPDEVFRLPFDEFILLWSRQYPYFGKKIMYYQDKRFLDSPKEKANLPNPNLIAVQKRFLSKTKNPWEFTLSRPYSYADSAKDEPGFEKAYEHPHEDEEPSYGNDYSILESDR